MTISPDICIMTRAELEEAKNAAFQRGVKRGEFERGMREPFADAMQIIELGCHLFWGRHGDGTHMDDAQYQQSHLEWYERASAFVKEQRSTGGETLGETK